MLPQSIILVIKLDLILYLIEGKTRKLVSLLKENPERTSSTHQAKKARIIGTSPFQERTTREKYRIPGLPGIQIVSMALHYTPETD